MLNTNTKIVKESAISFFGMGLGQLIRYLFTTLLARWAGLELLGIYSISNAITRIFEVIGKLGLDQGVLRAVSRVDSIEQKQKLILSALKMSLLSAMLFMFIQIFMSHWLTKYFFNQSSLLTKVIIIHALSLPFYILIHISASSTQAFKILKYKIFVSEIQNPFILLSTMVLFYFYFSLETTITFPVLISSVLGLFSINIFLKKITGVNILFINSGVFNKQLINYSLPIMFISILGTILHWTDILMLGYYESPQIVGLYHPSARTAGIIRIIFLAFSGIYGPILAQMYAKKQINEMNLMFKTVTRWIVTLALPCIIFLCLYSKKIMLIFGANFIVAYPILIILSVAAFIQAIFGIGGTSLNMTGFPKVNLFNTLVACGLNIGMNFILIPKYAGIGAASSTLITLTLIALLRLFQNYKLLQLYPFSWKMLKPTISAMLVLFISYFIKPILMPYHTIITLFSSSIIIFSLYFILLFILGIDDDDYGLINDIKNKLFNYKADR